MSLMVFKEFFLEIISHMVANHGFESTGFLKPTGDNGENKCESHVGHRRCSMFCACSTSEQYNIKERSFSLSTSYTNVK